MGRVWAAKISKNLSNPSVIKTVVHTPIPRHSTPPPQAWGRPKPPPFPGMTGIWRIVEDPALAAHPSRGWGGCAVGVTSLPRNSSLGLPCPGTLPSTAKHCQALPPLSTPRASCLAPLSLQGPRARALAAGAPRRAPLPARGINPSFPWAGLGPKQWVFCPARPRLHLLPLRCTIPSSSRLVLGSGTLRAGRMKGDTWTDSPIPRPAPHIRPLRGSIRHGDSLCPFSDHSTPLPQPRDVLSWLAPGGGEGTRTTGICDWVTPCQGHWAGSHPAAGHGVVGGGSALAGTPQELAHLLLAGTWEDQD